MFHCFHIDTIIILLVPSTFSIIVYIYFLIAHHSNTFLKCSTLSFPSVKVVLLCHIFLNWILILLNYILLFILVTLFSKEQHTHFFFLGITSNFITLLLESVKRTMLTLYKPTLVGELTLTLL